MSDSQDFPFPTMLPPTLQRISLDFESISKTPPRVDTGIELQFDKGIILNNKLNDTFSTCSSGNNDEEELTVSVISEHENNGDNKSRKFEDDDDDDEEEEGGMIRKRKFVFLIFALLPFIAASLSLFAAMTSRSSSSSATDDIMDNNLYATKDLDLESPLVRTEAPAFAPMDVSTDETSVNVDEDDEDDDDDDDDDPRSPSPRPTIEAAVKVQPTEFSETQQQQQQQQHGGLRSSSSPTAKTTNAPSSGPPTAAPTGYCVAAGVPCPNRNVALCCSDICARDGETGEMVCAPPPSIDDDDFGNYNFDNDTNNNARPPEEGNNRPQTNGYCVAAGIPCPNRIVALCCSDICSKDRDTGERLCAPIQSEEDNTPATTNTSPKEEEEDPALPVVAAAEENPAYCVQEGNPCPDRKVALCCSDICEKNKETKQYECAAVVTSSQKDNDKNDNKDKDKQKDKDR